jgi:hypothetical protein
MLLPKVQYGKSPTITNNASSSLLYFTRSKTECGKGTDDDPIANAFFGSLFGWGQLDGEVEEQCRHESERGRMNNAKLCLFTHTKSQCNKGLWSLLAAVSLGVCSFFTRTATQIRLVMNES